MMVQLDALQILVSEDIANNVGITSAPYIPDIEAIREGLTALEQLTRNMLYEVQAASGDYPQSELVGVTLTEALSRTVEETAEALGLSSRVIFSGEERPLASDIERLLYRIAQEALKQVQRHTNVRKLRFVLNYGHDEVQVSIEDDGVPSEQRDLTLQTNNNVLAPPFKPPDAATRFTMSGDDYVPLRNHIEHLGGSLKINASIEQGTQVQARIPYAHNKHTQTTTPSVEKLDKAQAYQKIDGSGNTRVRVLVVDAYAVTRAGLRHLLEDFHDLDVVGEAMDGVQAVSEAMELGPQVVIMDAQLPNGQSLEALRQIKQLNPDTRVLFLSSLDREDYLYETLQAGADGYVLKDIAANELAQAVRTVARGEVVVQPQIAGRLISRFGKQARGNTSHEALTVREQEVLRLLARGLRNKEIAARLYVSERTVNFHLANIYQKLNVSGRTEALSKALEKGLITV
jgi:DNA-binding NarL/FixJ family response regulator